MKFLHFTINNLKLEKLKIRHLMAEKNRNSGRPNLVGENYGTKEDFERIFGVQEKKYL